jgi:hypothetical protein
LDAVEQTERVPGFELRIMPNESSKWQWEVVIEGREVIARGFAETETTARELATEEARKAKLNFPWGTPIRIKTRPSSTTI